MFRLGRLYERGEGVKKDDGEALRWFRMAATGGHKEAAQRLAQLEEATLSIDKRDEHAVAPVTCAEDGVAFPIAEPATLVDNL